MKQDDIYKALRGMSWNEYNLAQDVRVDKYSLDVAAEELPMLMVKWSSALSQAQGIRDKIKETLSAIDAGLFLRAKRGEFPTDIKATDAGVKAWVDSHQEHQDAALALAEADANVAYLWGAKQAIEAKRAMVEMVAKLWLGNYFARPTVATDAVDKSMQEAKEAAREKVEKTLLKRKFRPPAPGEGGN